jgi:predicted nucleic acid-binding Zn ribbon protein
MLRWDFQCTQCGEVQEVSRQEREIARLLMEPIRCLGCGARCEWKPTATAFVVKGFNAKNGYSK